MKCAIALLILLTRLSAQADTVLEQAKATFKNRYPNTRISRFEKTPIAGLFQIQASTNLYYTDQSARYLIFGAIFDTETATDLTAAAKTGEFPNETE
ncbi:MAG: hypothetical protein GYB26_09980 [Gammaproteobacteria bacterium]|nr:hypothetical protein [Gammaproteobacteria bacterium]